MSRIEPPSTQPSAVQKRRRKLRLRMMLAGAALILLSVGFGTWALVLGTAFLAAPLGALLFLEPADAEQARTFCGRERATVNFLVAAPAIAVAAIEDIAAADRSINQENLRAVARYRLGRNDEALAITEQLTKRAEEPVTAGLLLNNRTWYKLQSGVSEFARLRGAEQPEESTPVSAADAPAWPAAGLDRRSKFAAHGTKLF
jgi:hypothetical protein